MPPTCSKTSAQNTPLHMWFSISLSVEYTDSHATYRIDLSILGRPSRTCLLKCDIRGTTLHMSEIQMRPDKGSSS